MKLLTKIAFLMLGYSMVAIILDSCGHCKNSNYDVDKISLKNLIYIPGTDQKCSSYEETTTTTFISGQFGIRINLHPIIYSYINPVFNLTKTALAMECWNTLTLQHKLEKIEVITLGNFDQEHIANSDISEYFRATDNQCRKLSSLDSTINNVSGINFQHTTGSISNIDLVLIKAPQSDSLFRFVIKVNFSNNELIDTTQSLIIHK